MRNQYCRVLLSGLMVLFIFGCQASAVRPPETVSTIDNAHPRAKLVIGSDELLRKVGIGNPQLRSLGQLTQAQVMVQNLTETRYTLEYKFDWEDDQGFNVASVNTWHRFTLTPRETKTFASTGKVPDAKNIVFTVRLPDDVFIESQKKKSDRDVNADDDFIGEE